MRGNGRSHPVSRTCATRGAGIPRRLRKDRPERGARLHPFHFHREEPEKGRRSSRLKGEFPGKDIRIESGDANKWVQSMCREPWDYRRAVLFLDPFGMQVSWQTLEAVAGTKSIDTWILFPLCVGITRLLSKNEIPDESMCRRLDFLFGDRTWLDAFYRQTTSVRPQKNSEAYSMNRKKSSDCARGLSLLR